MTSYDEWKLSNPWDDNTQETEEEREAREDAELLINNLKQEQYEDFSKRSSDSVRRADGSERT